MNSTTTPPARNIPRLPTAAELGQLCTWLQDQGYEKCDADLTTSAACVAVYDDYCTGCPGYCGKLMSVVWDGSPGQYDVFIWNDRDMRHVEKE